MGDVRSIVIDVPEAELDDLRGRLAATRWPAAGPDVGIEQGPTTAKIQNLIEHWRTRHDWRQAERMLNNWGVFRTRIDGLDIDFLHIRSRHDDAFPLLLTHGWPGSVLEFRHVIGALSAPEAHGGRAADAFHLVLPTLPGFGFSAAPTETGWGISRTAAAWETLMARLGYQRWGAQGGDLGSAVTEELARRGASGLAGIHLNMLTFQPTAAEIEAADAAELEALADAEHYRQHLAGYAAQQTTRPQTIGYAIADSPTGLAAWIYAIFQDACGTPGDAEASFATDDLLDNIAWHWLSGSAATAPRYYWEIAREGWHPSSTPDNPLALPTGVTMTARDCMRKSRRWTERRYTNLVHFGEAPAGGHFAAWEQPEHFVNDLRATFAGLRGHDEGLRSDHRESSRR
ncbi:epoxide hydrolase family protein [Dactylosporangium sp. CA-092794]|uniref:epoxide hydrolase family protein n=1 Tax=Dactylosporangium sp. CA-092794 TaxID=3239929 RepID=UPI003D914B44